MARQEEDHINILLRDIIGCTGWHAVFFMRDNVWTRVHLGQDWRGNAPRGQRYN